MTTSDKIWTRAGAVLAVAAATFALAGCSLINQVTGPVDLDPSDGTDTDAFAIAVGDCLNDTDLTGTEVSTVPTIDCAQPHDSEAFASIMVPDGDYPGDDAIYDQAVADCGAEFASFVGIAWEESTLAYGFYYPTPESWSNGDREILCLVYDPAGQTTGSLEGAAI